MYVCTKRFAYHCPRRRRLDGQTCPRCRCMRQAPKSAFLVPNTIGPPRGSCRCRPKASGPFLEQHSLQPNPRLRSPAAGQQQFSIKPDEVRLHLSPSQPTQTLLDTTIARHPLNVAKRWRSHSSLRELRVSGHEKEGAGEVGALRVVRVGHVVGRRSYGLEQRESSTGG